MDVFTFGAELWCGNCISAVKAKTKKPAHVDEDDESSYDSGDWPKGPYADGGGEADRPQHCADCGCFLKNPLTNDGVNYVAILIEEGNASSTVHYEWAGFYQGDHPRIEVARKRREAADALECGVDDLEKALNCRFEVDPAYLANRATVAEAIHCDVDELADELGVVLMGDPLIEQEALA